MSKHPDERDPLADYNEWVRNRYNPGYYLGGRLTPFMRGVQSLFSARERWVAAIVLVACVFLVIAGGLADAARHPQQSGSKLRGATGERSRHGGSPDE
jgi:hypothetical protein